MTEQEMKLLEKIKDDHELFDIVHKIMKLQFQINYPDRNGMIEALRDAQNVAHTEIVQTIEQGGGSVCSKPWDSITDQELYSMLSQYKQGLVNHGISKIGRGEFEKLLEAYVKRNIMP